MKDCSIIRDLLPLYAEKIASQETEAFVEQHLTQCPECAEELKKLQVPKEERLAEIKRIKDEKKALKRIKRKIRLRIFLISLSIVVFVFSALLAYDQHKPTKFYYRESELYTNEDMQEPMEMTVRYLQQQEYVRKVYSISYTNDERCIKEKAYIATMLGLDRFPDEGTVTHCMILKPDYRCTWNAFPVGPIMPNKRIDTQHFIFYRINNGPWQMLSFGH